MKAWDGMSRRHARGLCLLAAMLAIAVVAGSAIPVQAGAFDVSRNREIEIGREAAAVFERQVRLSRDGALNARLDRIGRRLVRVSDRPDLPYEFHVIETDSINALAFPGGFVYAFAGLIEALPSDDALAFVMAHEIAHAAKRHWARRYEKGRKLSVLTLGYADILQIFLQPHYSRRYESEADRYGLIWATKAGFAPEGAVQAMQTLKDLSRSAGSLPIFRSHPLTDKRIKRLTSHIEALKNGTLLEDEPSPDAEPESPRPEVLPTLAPAPADDGGLLAYELASNDHFPLRIRARWVYRCSTGEDGALRRVVFISGAVPGAEGAFRREDSYGHGVRASSLVAMTLDSVLVRRRPETFGTMWQVEWFTHLADGQSITDGDHEFVGGGTEEVTVPLGTHTAVRIEKRRVGSSSPTAIAWFVEDIGLVKQEFPADGLTDVLETFSPGDLPKVEASEDDEAEEPADTTDEDAPEQTADAEDEDQHDRLYR